MRDSRFPAQSTFWNDLIVQGRLAEGEPWLEQLVEPLHLALRESQFVHIDDESSAVGEILSAQLAALLSTGISIPEEIADALKGSFQVPTSNSASAQAAWCWGLALGKAAGDISTAQDLRRLLNIASRDFVMLDGFLQSTGKILFEGHPVLVTAVEQSVEQFVKSPGSFVLGGRGESFTRELDLWKTKPPYEAFDLRVLDHAPLHYELLGLFDRLRKFDLRVYLGWLDELQNPVLIQRAFLNGDIWEDFDQLLTLLEVAPPAYEDNRSDKWISSIAPMLLEVALHHVQSLLIPFSRPERDENAYKQLCDDLIERMHLLAWGLSRRKDGFQLAAHWLLRLVRMKTQLSGWHVLPVSMAIQGLVRVFGDDESNATLVLEGLPVSSPLSQAEKQKLRFAGLGSPSLSPTPRMDILMVRLLMKAFRQDTKGYDEERETFGDLLLMRDAGLYTDPNLSEAATWRHQLLGCVFGGSDLVNLWREYWDQLEEQRLRLRHSVFTSDHSADEASLFLCATALGLLQREGEGGKVKTQKDLHFWNMIYESAWFMSLLYGSQPDGWNWRYLLTNILGTLPKHLDISSDDGGTRLLELFVSFADDEELLIHSVARLLQAGTDSGVLMIALKSVGLDFAAILDRFGPSSTNVWIYPMSKRWPDAWSICRELSESGPKASRPEAERSTQ